MGNFAREVTSHLKHQPEGIRFKHYVGSNSVEIMPAYRTRWRLGGRMSRPGGPPYVRVGAAASSARAISVASA